MLCSLLILGHTQDFQLKVKLNKPANRVQEASKLRSTTQSCGFGCVLSCSCSAHSALLSLPLTSGCILRSNLWNQKRYAKCGIDKNSCFWARICNFWTTISRGASKCSRLYICFHFCCYAITHASTRQAHYILYRARGRSQRQRDISATLPPSENNLCESPPYKELAYAQI